MCLPVIRMVTEAAVPEWPALEVSRFRLPIPTL